jgi:hypothetical protein
MFERKKGRNMKLRTPIVCLMTKNNQFLHLENAFIDMATDKDLLNVGRIVSLLPAR